MDYIFADGFGLLNVTCVIHYDGFVGFKRVLEIIMFEYG